MDKQKSLFWFRRDLRLHDNHGLYQAMKASSQVQPIFIFDSHILNELERDDKRMPFLWAQIENLKKQLVEAGSDLWVFHGEPLRIFTELLKDSTWSSLYCNHDYEPGARSRDEGIQKLVTQNRRHFFSFKDQVIFEKSEVLSDGGKTYSVFTPYKKKWLQQLTPDLCKAFPSHKGFSHLSPCHRVSTLISLKDLGFENSKFQFLNPILEDSLFENYAKTRDFPFLSQGTSHLGFHLRFGLVSVREMVRKAKVLKAEVWLSELIWREFFMQILWHHPYVEKSSFRPEYEKIQWRNNSEEFSRWSSGETGFPLVDAGIRELITTGYMHNRVRMLVGSFLCKHLLTHWLYGERFFAKHLLDFDLSANNGNWQWCAGSGCDAAPYFRIFNPETQIEKFDPDKEYIRKWVPEFNKSQYAKPMVDHKKARERALEFYKRGLAKAEVV